jgi:hypothetical protein
MFHEILVRAHGRAPLQPMMIQWISFAGQTHSLPDLYLSAGQAPMPVLNSYVYLLPQKDPDS